MSYEPAADRYDRCPTGAAGAVGCGFRPSRSGSGRTSAATARSRRAARSSGAPSTSASPTSTSPTTTARPTARPRRTSAGCCARTSAPYRDELVISTKAGYDMWPGPYGEWGSRKYLLASLDQSLARMGLDYVDIFYSHRFDPDTPLEETMGALDTAVRQGKALYVGISSYSAERTREAAAILRGPGHAAPDPPAVVLDAQPLDRAGPARRARRGRSRLHRLLAAGPGAADRPVPRRASRRARGRAARRRCRPTLLTERDAREGPGAERDRRGARSDAGADGAGVDAARRADDLDV